MADYLYPNARIAIFAKAPIAGQVKTRMQPELSADQSALLQKNLIQHTINTAQQSHIAPIQFWCSPNTLHPSFQVKEITLKQQTGVDLGERMRNAFINNHNHDFTLLIGTDCPLLSGQHLQQAAHMAHQTDKTTIIPAHDGGYVLIGSSITPCCFENIEWGTEKVLNQSLSALKQHKQAYELIGNLPDLDNYDDFCALPKRLQQQLLPKHST